MTIDQQARKPLGPKFVVPFRAAPQHLLLDVLGQIVEVVLLVPHDAQQVDHFRASIFSLFAHLGQERFWEGAEPVFVQANDIGSE